MSPSQENASIRYLAVDDAGDLPGSEVTAGMSTATLMALRRTVGNEAAQRLVRLRRPPNPPAELTGAQRGAFVQVRSIRGRGVSVKPG